MFFENKSVLVTGGAGVIGTELLELLVKAKANVRSIDLKKPLWTVPGVDYHTLDLSHPESQFLFRFNPQIIFHLAADFDRAIESQGFWKSNFRNNILASHHLLSQAVNSPDLEKIVFASSYLIYDKMLYSDTSSTNLLTEESRINPRNLVGLAKLQTERDIEFLSETQSNKFSYASARIYRVYGRGSRDVISRWVRLLLQGKSIEVFSEDNGFDYIYSRDAAEGLMRMAETHNVQGIYNLSSGQILRIKDVVAILKDLFGDIEVKKTGETLFGEASCADMSKFRKDIDWIPSITVKQGIKEIIEFEQNKGVL